VRVLVTGSLLPWDLGASYRRAFASLGHEVELFGWYERHERWAALAPGRVSRAVLVASARRRTAFDLIVRAMRFKPDLVFLIKTDDLPRGSIGLLRRAAPACRIVAFHPDDPFNASPFQGPSHRRARYQMRSVDHYFIWSERLVGPIRRAGARDVSYLGFACDPELMHPVEIRDVDRARFTADVTFIGNWDRKRDAWLTPLAHSTEVSLAIWGPYWLSNARDARVLACCKGEPLRGDELVRAVMCSRASINILRPQNETAENMRSYEIPSCGGVMLAEWSVQQGRVFREGVEAIYARGPEDLAERARQLARSSTGTLGAMRAAALRRSSEHTYRDRAQSIVEAVELAH
jgi:spore maturation protein CgeB